MIKCINCQYFVKAEENDRKYPFCCLYCMPLDNVAIFELCQFAEKEDKKEDDLETKIN